MFPAKVLKYHNVSIIICVADFLAVAANKLKCVNDDDINIWFFLKSVLKLLHNAVIQSPALNAKQQPAMTDLIREIEEPSLESDICVFKAQI